MNLCVIVPAYNESASIVKTLNSILKLGYHVVVVDDGSNDNTYQLASNKAVKVLRLERNQGVGVAFREGLLYATRMKFDLVVQVDADGQHNPKDIAKLYKVMKTHHVDMALGSRYIKKTRYHTEWLRLISIWGLSWIIWKRNGKWVYDPTSGFRMMNRRAMDFVQRNYCGRCPEAMVVSGLIVNGFKIKEVPVEMRPRYAGLSHLTLWRGFCCLFRNISIILFFTKKLDH
jgi:glycosyltransferase involved in cell wall biosynthesis